MYFIAIELLTITLIIFIVKYLVEAVSKPIAMT